MLIRCPDHVPSDVEGYDLERRVDLYGNVNVLLCQDCDRVGKVFLNDGEWQEYQNGGQTRFTLQVVKVRLAEPPTKPKDSMGPGAI